ncbi:hypothetical protein CKAH01_13286, partial [Colletotrichum kahawae]
VPGYERFRLPSYAFLIENAEGRKVLFDLGLRKDWKNLTPEALHEIQSDEIKIDIERDVVDILLEGVANSWTSHHHWDHIGDMSRLPNTTSIVIGPGFEKAFLPGYPENPHSPVLQTDYENHEVRELDFSAQTVPIGPFKGIDFFGDGSFYLVDAPGHSIGHVCGIVRTTTAPDTFVFMGADAANHNGEFRPSQYKPLPESISPHPLLPKSVHPCPGESWARYLESRGRSKRMPFFSIPDTSAGAAYTYDVQASNKTIEMVQDIDSGEDILIVIAHDESIRGIVDFFPRSINDWKAKRWGANHAWAFLKDFQKISIDPVAA